MAYNLYSEREGKRTIERWGDSLASLGEYVEARERLGTWPEGHDAVAVPGSFTMGDQPDLGPSYIYTDGWEELSPG